MNKTLIKIAALLGALGVGVGAFGAHALKAILLATNRFDTFETAVRYQFYHALALLLVGVLSQYFTHKFITWAGYAFVAGVVIFSGSLYALCFSGITAFGAVAPVGGTCLIAGWLLLFLGIKDKP